MRAGKVGYVAGIIAVISFFTFTYQNCASSKFNDPNARHSAIAMGLCKICEDDAGSGLACRASSNAPYSRCFYEACNPGYLLDAEEATCTPVACEAGQHANCVVEHGQGTMTCASNSQGYGQCHAVQCEEGYHLEANQCVSSGGETTAGTTGETTAGTTGSTDGASTGETTAGTTGSTDGGTTASTTGETTGSTTGSSQVCVPGEHRECDTDSQYGDQICNEDGSAYGDCTLGACKPGYYNSENEGSGPEFVRPKIAVAPSACVPQTCTPGSTTPCTEGVGEGFQTCNSNGSGWGVCVIEACNDEGYVFQDGVCVVKVCTPGSKTTCDFDNGNGEKTCNSEGTDWGICQFIGCHNNYYKDTADEDGDGNTNECKKNKCTPSSQDSCVGDGGTGVMYCYENGSGHGPCKLTSCDEGFALNNGGQCVREDDCTPGDTFACSEQNGTGIRTCKANKKIGTCELNACNTGYTLTAQKNCKKN